MTKADSVHSTPPTNTSVHNPVDGLSRRHMLAGLAILPAVDIGIPTSATAGRADAELIELGRKFEVLVDAYYAARQPWARALTERNLELENRFGEPADRGFRDPPEYESAAKEIDGRLGMDEASDQLAAVHEEMEPIADTISAMSCTSIEGLRAKALVAFWGVQPLCAYQTEFTFDNEIAFHRLFSAVAEVCGLNGKIAATGYTLPELPDLCSDEEAAS
jgi:hypothetical protein